MGEESDSIELGFIEPDPVKSDSIEQEATDIRPNHHSLRTKVTAPQLLMDIRSDSVVIMRVEELEL